MRIDNDQVLSTVNQLRNESLEKKERGGKAATAAAAPGMDRVELSVRKEELEQLKLVMKDVSDVRLEKIARLRQEIADGSYGVEGADVAEKMLETWRALHGR
jgi:negative regulator of flagellin synthesis FlgM